MTQWRTLRYDALDKFRRSWPCHGLPDELHSISFQFAANGDIVDIEAHSEDGKPMDSAEFDGPALLALSQDAQQFGDLSD